MDETEIEINGRTYILSDASGDGLTYCIVRTYSAGVFFGKIDLEKIDGKLGVIYDSRRLWSWSGACSISQLAVDGTNSPDNCRFAMSVRETFLTEIIEVIPTSKRAEESINGVKIWKK